MRFTFTPDIKTGNPIRYETDSDCRSAWGKAIADLVKNTQLLKHQLLF